LRPVSFGFTIATADRVISPARPSVGPQHSPPEHPRPTCRRLSVVLPVR
jgi:hypothetical protein